LVGRNGTTFNWWRAFGGELTRVNSDVGETAVKEDIGTVNGDIRFNLKNHGAENEIGPFHGLKKRSFI
jgi:hypothetical protein